MSRIKKDCVYGRVAAFRRGKEKVRNTSPHFFSRKKGNQKVLPCLTILFYFLFALQLPYRSVGFGLQFHLPEMICVDLSQVFIYHLLFCKKVMDVVQKYFQSSRGEFTVNIFQSI